MPTELVEITRFLSSAEASIVRDRLESEGIRAKLDGESVAGWLWQLGPTIGGVHVLIRREDLDRARQILAMDATIDPSDDLDFGDDDRSVDDGDDQDRPELPEDLIRAWRASIMGFGLCPPLLNIYSTWLLLRHRFFVGQCQNWRVGAASVANAVMFASIILFFVLIANRPEPEIRGEYTLDGEPVPNSLEESRTYTIPMVP